MISNCVNNLFDGAQGQLHAMQQMLANNEDGSRSIVGNLACAIVIVPIEVAVEIVRHVAIAVESAVFAVISFFAITFGIENSARYTLQNLRSVFYNLALVPCKVATSMIFIWPKILTTLFVGPSKENYGPKNFEPTIITEARKSVFDSSNNREQLRGMGIYPLAGTTAVDFSGILGPADASSMLFKATITEFVTVLRKEIVQEQVQTQKVNYDWALKKDVYEPVTVMVSREIYVPSQQPVMREVDVALSSYGHFIESYDHNSKILQNHLLHYVQDYAGSRTGEDTHSIRSRAAGVVIATIDVILEVVRPLFLAISCLVLATVELAFTAVAIATMPITLPFGFPFMVGEPKPEHERGRFETAGFSYKPIEGLLEFSAMSLKHINQAAEYLAQTVANAAMMVFNWVPQMLSVLYDPQEITSIDFGYYKTMYNDSRLSLSGWETNMGGLEIQKIHVQHQDGTIKPTSVLRERGLIHWVPTRLHNQFNQLQYQQY